MNTVDARLSPAPRWGKYAVCGACGESIVRRNRVPADPVWNSGRDYAHVLDWGPEWRLVPATGDEPAYLTRDDSSRQRYARGNAPVRGRPGPSGAAHYIAFGPSNPLALCSCGALNRMDPRTLHVQALPTPPRKA
jgi:hypothetical protein